VRIPANHWKPISTAAATHRTIKSNQGKPSRSKCPWGLPVQGEISDCCANDTRSGGIGTASGPTLAVQLHNSPLEPPITRRCKLGHSGGRPIDAGIQGAEVTLAARANPCRHAQGLITRVGVREHLSARLPESRGPVLKTLMRRFGATLPPLLTRAIGSVSGVNGWVDQLA